MTGKHYPLMRVLFRLMKMEKSIGANFERGLSRLKAVVAVELISPPCVGVISYFHVMLLFDVSCHPRSVPAETQRPATTRNNSPTRYRK